MENTWITQPGKGVLQNQCLGGIEILTKVILYYLHERGWANLEWGIVRERNLPN
ncbi:MAG: DUF2061 domain-containing protein [Candidatus Poseidoniales archaeon]